MKENADKLFLLALIAVFVLTAIHFAHTGDMDSSHWAREQTNEVVGAILLSITGQAIRNKVNSNDQSPK